MKTVFAMMTSRSTMNFSSIGTMTKSAVRGSLPSTLVFRLAFALCLVGMPVLDLQMMAATVSKSSEWERSVVTVEVTRKLHDYIQPWSARTASFLKAGTLIGPDKILTTAEFLSDYTLIRLQKGGRGKWFPGKVAWVDYHANLALVTSEDPTFWVGLKPARLTDATPTKGEVALVRWKDGRFENRKAEITRFDIKKSKLSYVEHLSLQVDCEAKAVGWGEPIVSDGRLMGLTTGQDGNSCSVIPAAFIKPIVDAVIKGTYRGLGYFDFTWQRAENPSIHKFLKWEGEPRGVVVIDVPKIPGVTPQLKTRDIILKIDGFNIDTQGDFKDPVFGELLLEGLATRGKWAGDEFKLSIWRDGKIQDVSYKLPKVSYATDLVPQAIFDQPPEYVIVGGLVFETLSEPYLRSWGNDWRRRVPFRLGYYQRDHPTPERPTVVILSLVLPDTFNIGYQEYRYLAVHKINGQLIARLSDVPKALKKPVDGFHVIEFERGDVYRRLVLDAAETDTATRRILERYRIEKDRVLAN